MKKNQHYYFKFAGIIIKGKFIKEDILNDNTKVFMFNDGKFTYPIRKENLCGNLKQ